MDDDKLQGQLSDIMTILASRALEQRPEDLIQFFIDTLESNEIPFIDKSPESDPDKMRAFIRRETPRVEERTPIAQRTPPSIKDLEHASSPKRDLTVVKEVDSMHHLRKSTESPLTDNLLFLKVLKTNEHKAQADNCILNCALSRNLSVWSKNTLSECLTFETATLIYQERDRGPVKRC